LSKNAGRGPHSHFTPSPSPRFARPARGAIQSPNRTRGSLNRPVVGPCRVSPLGSDKLGSQPSFFQVECIRETHPARRGSCCGFVGPDNRREVRPCVSTPPPSRPARSR
jgi:hypothetical protein